MKSCLIDMLACLRLHNFMPVETVTLSAFLDQGKRSFKTIDLSIAGHNPCNVFLTNRLQQEFHHNVVNNNRAHGNVCGCI